MSIGLPRWRNYWVALTFRIRVKRFSPCIWDENEMKIRNVVNFFFLSQLFCVKKPEVVTESQWIRENKTIKSEESPEIYQSDVSLNRHYCVQFSKYLARSACLILLYYYRTRKSAQAYPKHWTYSMLAIFPMLFCQAFPWFRSYLYLHSIPN